MSGLKNFDNIKENIKESDIICLCETWHTYKCNISLSQNHEISDRVAIKTAERGRASGGLAIALNNKIYKNTEFLCARDEFLFIKTNVNESIVIVGVVYINQKKDTKLIFSYMEEELNKISKKYKSYQIFITGDFNARVADKGEIEDGQLPDQNTIYKKERESEDPDINERGRDLLDFTDRNELFITNGRFPSDTPARYTSINTLGKSVIDLILCNAQALCNVLDFKVCKNGIIQSDHLPVLLSIEFNINFNNYISKDKIKWKENKKIEYYNSMLYSDKGSFIKDVTQIFKIFATLLPPCLLL